jgi:hypothetical protein
VDTVDTVVDAIKLSTDNLPSDPADASVVAGLIAAVEAKVDIIDTNVDAINIETDAAAIANAVWDSATADQMTAGSFGLALGTTVPGYIDTEIAAIKAKTDNLPSDPADASVIAGRFDTLDTSIADVPTATENADALLKRDWTSVTGEASRSVLNALRAIRNKFSTSATPGTATFYKEDDTTVAFTKTLTTDADAPPIVEG